MTKKKKRPIARRRQQDFDPFDLLMLPLDYLAAQGKALREALRQRPTQLFVVVFMLALAARLLQPDWYTNRTFHPDERWLFDKTAELHVLDVRAGFPFIGEPGRTDGAGLQYGSLPLYVVSVFKDGLGLFRIDPYRASILCGRAITGVVDATTVLLTFMLGLRLFGAWPALLAAVLLAGTPLSIQLSHFFTVDPWMTCFSVAVLYASTRVAQTRRRGWSIAAGLAYAAALASKSGALPLVLPITLGHLWGSFEPGLKLQERKARAMAAGIDLAIAAGVTVLGFACFMPYAFLHWSKFVQNQTAQQGILVKGEPAGVPFVRQYWDTGVGFHLRQIAQFYMGPPLGLLALLSLPLAAWLGVKKAAAAYAPVVKIPKKLPQPEAPASLWRKAWAPLLLLSWALPYYGIVGNSFAKFARYMLPLMPVLALSLSLAVTWLAERSTVVARRTGIVLGLLALGWGTGYAATYFRPHPWIETSKWALAELPRQIADPSAPGGQRQTLTLNEDWGDDLPVDVPGGNAGSFTGLKGRPDQVNIVEWDSPNKLDRMSNSLSQTDVIFMADARAYGTYLRLPTRFPLTHAYYDLMFHDPGRLGFKLAHQASNPIRFFGVGPALKDSRIPSVNKALWADESFTLYDRPHAFSFTREKPMTKEEVTAVLGDHIKELGLSDNWRNGVGPEALELESKGLAPASVNAPEAEQRLNPNYGTSRGNFVRLGHPVLAWWVLVTLMGWLALPLAMKLFQGFPAGGYALSKALGVFLFAWLAYNLAWMHILAFHQAKLWVLLGAMLSVGLVFLKKQEAAARAWVRANKTEILWSEAVFGLSFLFFVIVRAYNPNIHDITGQGYFGGGEPLGMTYLSAVTRASTFPLYDPWLALRDSSYYYFGYVIAGSIGKLSGFQASISYNLALALFFSLSMLTAYGVLRGLVQQRKVAVAGASLVALAGSLWSVAYIAIQATRGTFPLAAWISHGFIWDPSRFPELINGHILEFPFFSYLYSDLHPHNMVVAFSLLLVGLLLVPFKSSLGGWRSLGATRTWAWAWIVTAGLLLDAQYAINTWSWPVYLALSAGVLLIAPWAGKKLGFWKGLESAGWGLGAFLAMAVIGRVLMRGFRAYYLQDGANRVGAVMPSEWQMSAYIPLAYYLPGLMGLALLAGQRLRSFAPSLAKDAAWARFRKRGLFTALTESPLQLMDKRPFLFWPVAGFAVLSAVLLACVGLYYGAGGSIWMRVPGSQFLTLSVGGVSCLGLWLGLTCLAFFSLQGWLSGTEAFLWVVGGFTLFLVWGSEQFYVADRTNTLFKFWFNGWILMGLVAAAAFGPFFDTLETVKAKVQSRLKVVKLKGAKKLRAQRIERLKRWLPSLAGLALFLSVFVAAFMDAELLGRGGRFVVSFGYFSLLLALLLALGAMEPAAWVRGIGRGVFGGLLALGLVYPVGATLARIRDASGFSNPHLDGLAFMKERAPRPQSDAHDYDADDAGLIEWLNSDHAADRTETLVETPGLQMYQGYNRYAIYTGLPTLLGWDYQVSQQLGNRTGGTLEARKRDAATIYGPDEAAAVALLKQYHVRWIVVGSLERRTYPGDGLAKFDHIATSVKQSGQAVLYRFDYDAEKK